MKFSGIDPGEILVTGYEVFRDGKVVGKITAYDPETSTITYEQYGWLRRTWRRFVNFVDGLVR